MLYREIIAVCSHIHTKHINRVCRQNVELLNVKLVVHLVTTVLLRKSLNEVIVFRRLVVENLIVVLSVRKFRLFNANQHFITLFTTVCHWSLTSARWVHPSSSHPISLRSVLVIFPSTLNSSEWPLWSGFHARIMYVFLFALLSAARPSFIWT